MSLKSIIQLTENLKSLYIKTAKNLKGSDRRQFMASVVKEEIETRINRLPNLKKCFVEIFAKPA
ncbi:hypothetical protein [Nostoc sp.]|uniref:hypothetical protein n=1 Tax=Nostoc sp. TaxID=1180 RepID=UPI002FF8B588